MSENVVQLADGLIKGTVFALYDFVRQSLNTISLPLVWSARGLRLRALRSFALIDRRLSATSFLLI
jgi:hypothetical protein